MMDEILWPEFVRYSKILRELIEDIMQDVIKKIHDVEDDEMIIAEEIGFKEV